MGCLSGCGPCEYIERTGEVCDVCRQSKERYFAEAKEKAIRDAERVLKASGYTVTPPHT